MIDLYPEYRGNITHLITPEDDYVIDSTDKPHIERATQHVRAQSGCSHLTLPVDGDYPWLRDHALYLGRKEGRPLMAFPDPKFSPTRLGPLRLETFRMLLADAGIDTTLLRMDFEGGDLVVGPDAVYVGFKTVSDTQQRLKGSYHKTRKHIAREFLEQGALARFLPSAKSEFYHADTVLGFAEGADGQPTAVVASATNNDSYLEDNQYANTIAESLEHSMRVIRVPASTQAGQFWSASNLVQQGNKAYLAGAPSTDLESKAQQAYASIGIKAVSVPWPEHFVRRKGGLRCLTLTIRE